MVNKINEALGRQRSAIRELFEYAKRRKAEIGEDRVFDFSLGNPSAPTAQAVSRELIKLIEETDPVTLHGYTSAQGDYGARKAVSDSLNACFSLEITPDCVYLTCGAAASLAITLNALLNAGDEVVVFAPFFPEYRVFIEHAGGKVVAVPCTESFLPDLQAFRAALSDKTKAVIINSPNNPSGVAYPPEKLLAISEELTRRRLETGNEIYLVSDEPYRELIYSSTPVASVFNYYAASIICYSYSKSLSLAGERIGYIAVNNRMPDFDSVYAAVCGAGRALGYVCAPALFQRLLPHITGVTADFTPYKNNLNLLYSSLTGLGFKVVKPDGAFYLFVKSPFKSAAEFAEVAKKRELLLVPSDSFGVEGYVRISCCVSESTVKNSLPAFSLLAKDCGLK